MTLSLGTGLGLTAQPSTVAPFSPGDLTLAAWYDPSDLSTLWQDAAGTTPVTSDSDPVGRIDDKSGNGRHATQGTAGSRPLYHVSGGVHWLEFDGTDDGLQAAFSISQPFERISAIRQLSWTAGDQVYGGVTANAGTLYQVNVSPQLVFFDGTFAVYNSDADMDEDAIVTELHDGASSTSTINRGTPATGDPGTDAPGGITIGNNFIASGAADMRFYGLVMAATLSGAERVLLEDWLAAKAGISL